jgi:hypothetical protein
VAKRLGKNGVFVIYAGARPGYTLVKGGSGKFRVRGGWQMIRQGIEKGALWQEVDFGGEFQREKRLMLVFREDFRVTPTKLS